MLSIWVTLIDSIIYWPLWCGRTRRRRGTAPETYQGVDIFDQSSYIPLHPVIVHISLPGTPTWAASSPLSSLSKWGLVELLKYVIFQWPLEHFQLPSITEWSIPSRRQEDSSSSYIRLSLRYDWHVAQEPSRTHATQKQEEERWKCLRPVHVNLGYLPIYLFDRCRVIRPIIHPTIHRPKHLSAHPSRTKLPVRWPSVESQGSVWSLDGEIGWFYVKIWSTGLL